MVARLMRTADFERVLSHPPRSRSAHFAVHHVAAGPSLPKKPARQTANPDLSTGDAPSCPPPVDDSPAQHWLGMVVPKRHARRSVTRNLLKRQMRSVMDEQAHLLPPGLWVLRLKAPFDRARFPSPASDPLRADARKELQALLQRTAARG